jgi:hypothetical protein
LALLLLKVNPEDLMHDVKAAYIAKTDGSGCTERLYTDYASGDYPIDVQNVVHGDSRIKYNRKKPLIIYVSIFIDGALMNSTHTTSATPILFPIINDKKKNSTVVGFKWLSERKVQDHNYKRHRWIIQYVIGKQNIRKINIFLIVFI